MQAMKYKGTLKIRTIQQDDWVRISIEDTGTGIPDDIQPKIFDAFFSTKGEGESSGMGLFICKQIVDKHQGKIDLESQPGRTVFTVSLPTR